MCMVNTGPLLLLTALGPHWHHAEGQLVSTPATLSRALLHTPHPNPAWRGQGMAGEGDAGVSRPLVLSGRASFHEAQRHGNASADESRRDGSLASTRRPGFHSVTFGESRYKHHGGRKKMKISTAGTVYGNIPSPSPLQQIIQQGKDMGASRRHYIKEKNKTHSCWSFLFW